jgi:hypothetical protein
MSEDLTGRRGGKRKRGAGKKEGGVRTPKMRSCGRGDALKIIKNPPPEGVVL